MKFFSHLKKILIFVFLSSHFFFYMSSRHIVIATSSHLFYHHNYCSFLEKASLFVCQSLFFFCEILVLWKSILSRLLAYCWFICRFNVSAIVIQSLALRCDKREYSQKNWAHQKTNVVDEVFTLCEDFDQSRTKHWDDREFCE